MAEQFHLKLVYQMDSYNSDLDKIQPVHQLYLLRICIKEIRLK